MLLVFVVVMAVIVMVVVMMTTAAAMTVAVTVPMPMIVAVAVMVVRAAVAAMRFVNACDSIHYSLATVFLGHTRHVIQGYEVEDIAGQADKRCDHHDISIYLEVMLVDDSIGCLESKPHDHRPYYQDTRESSDHFGSVVTESVA